MELHHLIAQPPTELVDLIVWRALQGFLPETEAMVFVNSPTSPLTIARPAVNTIRCPPWRPISSAARADILVGDNLTNVQAANARGGTPRTPIGENGMAKKAKRAMRREWTNENVRELKR